MAAGGGLSAFSIVKTRLNLASQPFRNRALPWTITAVISITSILALIFIARATVQTNAAAQTVQRDVADLQKQTQTLAQRTAEVKSALTPDQVRTLKSAHVLVDRKRFSWSRLFADLEAVLPGDVRVARITVKDVMAQGDRTTADLELVVASKSPTVITEMIRQMERDGVFQAVLISQNAQRGKVESGAEYELQVHYVPRYGSPVESSEQATRPVDTAMDDGSRTQR
jgi:Tfp pilus assembly protein PilN